MTKEGLFPKVIEEDINLENINIQFFSKWVEEKIAEILGFEDEIVIGFIINVLETSKTEKKKIPGKKFQLELTGFLEKKTPAFVEELWTLLLDAQGQPSGIPSVVIERKKKEILEREERAQSKHSDDQRKRDRPVSRDLEEENRNDRGMTERRHRGRDRERRRSPSPRRGDRDRLRVYGRDRSISRSRSRERRDRDRYRGDRRREGSRDRDNEGRRRRDRSRSREGRRSSRDEDRRRYRSRSGSEEGRDSRKDD